jgi:LysM repeat protein
VRAKWWVLFIGLNIIVSVATSLVVLSLKGESEKVVVVTATPGPDELARATTPAPARATQLPPASPTTPSALEYTVQTGDTLGGIAVAFDIPLEDLLLANNLTQDDFIQPGQTLIIPLGEVVTPTPVRSTAVPATETPEVPTAFPTETPTPPGPVEVRIQEVLAPGELSREGVVIVNRGRTVNLAGWTLAAAGGEETYDFPRLTLTQETPVTVYTMPGEDSPQMLHWGLTEAQWSESGTIIELRDGEGSLIATFPVP